MNKKFLLFFSFILTLFTSLLFLTFPVLAADSQGEGLTISPPLAEFDFTPGKNYDEVIKVNNPTKEVVEVYPIARNFSASGESGVPAIETPTESADYGLASWITFFQSKLVLTPEQEIQFRYRISVPTNAEPGGHYGAVLFASQPPKADENATQVSLASMVGSLILGKVSGNVAEKAEVKEFSASRWLYLKSPVDFILRINNTGNVHIKPKGDIVIKNWGRKVGDLAFNPGSGNVLPNSTRKFDNLSFNSGFWAFGRYTANLTAVYGSQNATLTDTVVFWIIPWWLIVILLVIIVLIIFYFLRKKRKKRKGKLFEVPFQAKKKIIIQ